MCKQTNHYQKLFLPIVLLAVILTSCGKDNDAADTALPVYQIQQSEKLAIPFAVDLNNLPGGSTRLATYFARGVQKYKAQPKAGTNPVTYEWVFMAPEASLFDISNKKIGTHGAGPFWELSPGDSIFGQHFAPARTAPSPGGNSIDWLLLQPKAGKTPTGFFAHVAYIQRIATTGGKAPAQLPLHANETANSNYTAIYRFSKKN